MESTDRLRQPDWVEVPRLQLRVTPMTGGAVAEWIATSSGRKQLLLNHNLHSAYLHLVDAEFRELYTRADRVVIDGAPILALIPRSRRRSIGRDVRIGSTDWIEDLSSLTTFEGRLFVYGATPESNRMCVDELRRRLPAWHVSGIDGYVTSERATSAIADYNPDLVLVGLGMPKQEKFLRVNWGELPPATYATVGGAIDYIAGAARLAPRWVGRIGLEWLWRLANDPARLAHRYLVEPFRLALALRDRQKAATRRERIR